MVVGHSKDPSAVGEGKILNRVVRATPQGWEYESDQRHAEIIVNLLGVSESRVVAAPGVADSKENEEVEQQKSELLSPEQATLYRGIAARANFLSQDRSDIQYIVKEICRSTSAPD